MYRQHLFQLGILAGENDGLITTCYTTGQSRGVSRVGGLAGSNDGSISQSYSNAYVSGTSNVGGLVGQNWGKSITNCYSSGSVTGTSAVGGHIGLNRGILLQSYSTAFVEGQSGTGGLVGGSGAGSFRNCFWDTQTSGQVSSAVGLGKTTQALQNPKTFVGWSGEIWTLLSDQDFPRLAWENKPSEKLPDLRTYTGSGSRTNPISRRPAFDWSAYRRLG